MDFWENLDAEHIDWLQIGGQEFPVQVGTLAFDNGWADWTGENGDVFGAPTRNIEAVRYR